MTSNELPADARSRWLRAAAYLLVLVLGVRVLHREAHAAGDLRVTPDEVEYAVCAQRLATLGRYDMELDGVSTPPHSTPWFSALLAVAYLLGPDEIGNGIWVVLALSLVALLLVQRIGERVSGPLGGALAVVAILATAVFPYTSRLIMTDAPAVAVSLAATLLFLRAFERSPSVRASLCAGLLIAAGFALRSVYLSLLAPFAWLIWKQPERRALRSVALLAPLAAVVAGNALYNHATLGDWRRTGYQLWCAVPYDYPDLLLSLGNVPANLADLCSQLGTPMLVLGAVGVPLLLWRARATSWRFLAFVAVTALPISALHLVYFYSDLRFHSWLLVNCAAAGGFGIAALLPARWRARPELALVALAIALFAVPDPREFPALRRRASDELQQWTPPDALVISGLEPVYLAALERTGSQRRFLAASRDTEFASKLLTRVRVDRDVAKPRDPYDHRVRGLVFGGSVEAHEHTADEIPHEIERAVRDGRPVYIERSFIVDRPNVERRILGASLRLEDPAARVTRIVLAR